MPRPRRLNIAGIPQHITQRGNNRQVCFFCDEDRFTCLEILRRSAQRRTYDIELHPVRAGMVASPAEYCWSSHRYNAMGWENDLISPQEEWLSLGKNKDARCAAYRVVDLTPFQPWWRNTSSRAT